MIGIHKKQLSNGVQVIWSTPLSGFGHIADEQPLPYLHSNNIELTPRFGGEEQCESSGIDSIPLPYGKLTNTWPWRQRLFNLLRRRVNIYWRNILQSRCRSDRYFYIIEQLKFKEVIDGFVGYSPVLDFYRSFVFQDNEIIVNDKIIFNMTVAFDEFYACPWAEFDSYNSEMYCQITPSLIGNYRFPIQSSSGNAIWHAHKMNNVQFNKGEILSWNYQYQVK